MTILGSTGVDPSSAFLSSQWNLSAPGPPPYLRSPKRAGVSRGLALTRGFVRWQYGRTCSLFEKWMIAMICNSIGECGRDIPILNRQTSHHVGRHPTVASATQSQTANRRHKSTFLHSSNSLPSPGTLQAGKAERWPPGCHHTLSPRSPPPTLEVGVCSRSLSPSSLNVTLDCPEDF